MTTSSRAYSAVGQRVALAASLWVAASLIVAFATFWWQATEVGGLGQFHLPLLIPALGFAGISFGLRILRWHFFLGATGAHPALRFSAYTQLIGFSLTMTPGKIGELYKCFLIERRTGVPTGRTAPIVLFEKGMDAAAFALLALGAALLLPIAGDSVGYSLRVLAVIAALLVGATVMLRAAPAHSIASALLRASQRVPLGKKLGRLASALLNGSADLLRGPVLARAAVLSLAARTCDGLALTWSAWAIGIDLPALGGVLALNSAGALGGLSMLPGGIGVVEASMSVILTGFGASAGAALAGTLAARLLTFWLWVAAGLALLIRAGLVSRLEEDA